MYASVLKPAQAHTNKKSTRPAVGKRENFRAQRQTGVTTCLKVVGRASAGARPRNGGRTATEARPCARPCAADKTHARRAKRKGRCDRRKRPCASLHRAFPACGKARFETSANMKAPHWLSDDSRLEKWFLQRPRFKQRAHRAPHLSCDKKSAAPMCRDIGTA